MATTRKPKTTPAKAAPRKAAAKPKPAAKTPTLDPKRAAKLAELSQAAKDARAALMAEVIAARKAGGSIREVARAASMSYQRIQQLTPVGKPATPKAKPAPRTTRKA